MEVKLLPHPGGLDWLVGWKGNRFESDFGAGTGKTCCDGVVSLRRKSRCTPKPLTDGARETKRGRYGEECKH